jgi:Holliday junction resolvasome RuvABC endonuclease subunit
MTVLAIDIGTHLGFAMNRPSGVYSGTEEFPARAREPEGQRWVDFAAWLSRTKAENPDLTTIAYEKVMFQSFNQKSGKVHSSQAPQVYGGFLAVMQMWCAVHRVELQPFGVGTIKKRFTGHGGAAKEDVVAQCKSLGFNPQCHNEADAIAILHVALDICPLLTMSGKSSGKVKTTKAKAKPVATASGALPEIPF